MKYGCRVVPEDESGVGKQGSEGARVRAPRVSMYFTAGDTGRWQTTGERGAGFSFSNTDIEIYIAIVVVWTVILHSRSV